MHAKNPKPQIVANLAHYAKKPPYLIRYIWDYVLKYTAQVRGSLLKACRRVFGRHKRRDRLNAIMAIIGQLIPHIDIETGCVQSTASQLAHEAELVTYSALSDKPSITRATRAIHDMASMGLLLVSGGALNPDTGERDPLRMTVTADFWQTLGVSPRELAREQYNKQAKRLRDAGMLDYGESRYSVAEFKRSAKTLADSLYRQLCEKVQAHQTAARKARKAANDARKAAHKQRNAEQYAKAKADRQKAQRYAQLAEAPRVEQFDFDTFHAWDAQLRANPLLM